MGDGIFATKKSSSLSRRSMNSVRSVRYPNSVRRQTIDSHSSTSVSCLYTKLTNCAYVRSQLPRRQGSLFPTLAVILPSTRIELLIVLFQDHNGQPRPAHRPG